MSKKRIQSLARSALKIPMLEGLVICLDLVVFHVILECINNFNSHSHCSDIRLLELSRSKVTLIKSIVPNV